MMENPTPNQGINIPNKRYFTIGEASKICDIKAHVLRYWEQEFKELDPIKRKGNRRYYQQKDLILVLQIKDLLQNQGFTVDGAVNMISSVNEKTTEKPHSHLVKQLKSDLENVLSILKK